MHYRFSPQFSPFGELLSCPVFGWYGFQETSWSLKELGPPRIRLLLFYGHLLVWPVNLILVQWTIPRKIWSVCVRSVLEALHARHHELYKSTGGVLWQGRLMVVSRHSLDHPLVGESSETPVGLWSGVSLSRWDVDSLRSWTGGCHVSHWNCFWQGLASSLLYLCYITH